MNEFELASGFISGFGIIFVFIALAYFVYTLTTYYNRWLNTILDKQDRKDKVDDLRFKIQYGLLQQIADEENVNISSIDLEDRKNTLKDDMRESLK